MSSSELEDSCEGLELDYDDYDYDYCDDYYNDDDERQRAERLDRAWLRARVQLDAALSLNRLTGLGARRVSVPARPPLDDIEGSVVAHLESLDADAVDAQLADEIVTHELAILAELPSSPHVDTRELAIALILFRRFWLRSPLTWTPGSAPSLVEHLLVAYDYPRFLRNAWHELSQLRWIAWMIVAAQGGSLRRLSLHGRWPTLGKKLPGLLHRVPAKLAPVHGLMYAEILRLGGSDVEFRRLRSDHSFILDPTTAQADELEFWRSTVVWLSRHRDELHALDVTLVLAWARHMQTEDRDIGRSFSWAGRTPAAVLREAREYDNARRRSWYGYIHRRWPPLGLDWSEEIAGVTWTIRELCDSDELGRESARMRHCVYSYAHKCWRRQSAIFSLSCGDKPCLTIELSLPDRQMVQVRGTCNRVANATEIAVLDRWVHAVVVVD